MYEAYGAGGTGFIMECLTDNVNRSATGESAHSYAWAVCILQWSGHSRVTVMKMGKGFEYLSSTAKCCHIQALPLPVADVRTAVVKGGGKMADSGSVMFNFQRQGQIHVKGSASTEEEVSCKTTCWYTFGRPPLRAVVRLS